MYVGKIPWSECFRIPVRYVICVRTSRKREKTPRYLLWQCKCKQFDVAFQVKRRVQFTTKLCVPTRTSIQMCGSRKPVRISPKSTYRSPISLNLLFYLSPGRDYLHNSPCPIVGEYFGVIPNAEGQCAKLASDCSSPDTMYFSITDCAPEVSPEVYEGIKKISRYFLTVYAENYRKTMTKGDPKSARVTSPIPFCLRWIPICSHTRRRSVSLHHSSANLRRV